MIIFSNHVRWLMEVVRLLRDAELFDTKLNKIDGFGDVGTKIIDIVKSKNVGGSESTKPDENSEEK